MLPSKSIGGVHSTVTDVFLDDDRCVAAVYPCKQLLSVAKLTKKFDYIICVEAFQSLTLILAQVNLKCSNNKIRDRIKTHY